MHVTKDPLFLALARVSHHVQSTLNTFIFWIAAPTDTEDARRGAHVAQLAMGKADAFANDLAKVCCNLMWLQRLSFGLGPEEAKAIHEGGLLLALNHAAGFDRRIVQPMSRLLPARLPARLPEKGS